MGKKQIFLERKKLPEFLEICNSSNANVSWINKTFQHVQILFNLIEIEQ